MTRTEKRKARFSETRASLTSLTHKMALVLLFCSLAKAGFHREQKRVATCLSKGAVTIPSLQQRRMDKGSSCICQYTLVSVPTSINLAPGLSRSGKYY